MIKKPSGVRRRLLMIGTAGGSIADLVGGLWRSDSGKRWLIPLAVFLCVFGVVLILATTIEALAPFIYAIF
jgi:hypothetical protein